MKKTVKIIISIITIIGGVFATSYIAMKAVDFFLSREKKLYQFHSDHLDEDIIYDKTAEHPDFKVDDAIHRVYITLPR
jgi:hypothetical protein